MRIDRIRVVRTPLHMVNPLRTSDGSHESRVATLVEIRDSEGVIGWGENVAPAGVAYVGENAAESVIATCEVIAPLLAGRDVDVFEMMPESWWGVAGHHFAKHAVESAVWDLHARRESRSLRDVLGGSRTSITPGVVVGIADTVAETVAEVQQRIAEGYGRVKVKISRGRDVDVLRAIRAACGDALVLQADANAAYSKDDIALLCSFDEFNLQFIEQPFAAGDLGSHAELARRSRTAVCLDESICTVDELMGAIEMKACSVVNVKPSRVGGIGAAVQMHHIVKSHGIDAWVGGMLESGIGRASCLALASLPGFTMTPDLSASSRYFASDITVPFEMVNGEIQVPAGPGIGVQPLPEVLSAPETRIQTVFER
ncbi:MAG: o-succinylbenzoate synthase [Ilumatobacteraceae bacterium]|nr:o-succinylbenzoate synthase [Ilumatobacteraceae bacterium]